MAVITASPGPPSSCSKGLWGRSGTPSRKEFLLRSELVGVCIGNVDNDLAG